MQVPAVVAANSLEAAPAALTVAALSVMAPLNARVNVVAALVFPIAVAGNCALPTVYLERSL